MRKFLTLLGILLLVATVLIWMKGSGSFGTIDGVRVEPTGGVRSDERVAAVAAGQRLAANAIGAPAEKQILFGDLHVHTTLSSDAFMMNLPMLGGAGALSPADACDFARHCAALDFWSINDHANGLYPEDWKNTVDAIRECNARSGDAQNPDTVAFLGWEWTQAGLTPGEHYGHKNVVLAHTDDERIPTRPIAAKQGGLLMQSASPFVRGGLALVDDRFSDLSRRIADYTDAPYCGTGHVRELDSNCREVATTPPELFRKLDEWGHDAIVIPHGTAWGVYTPPGSSWSKQLKGVMHDSDRQTLLEVYSGHGDSEVYRDWRAVSTNASGALICPEERLNYLPPCRQAGKIIERRCLAEGASADECAARAEKARQNAVTAGKDYVVTIEGSNASDWLDAGQCRDCVQPSFNYVATGSAQYIAAISDFDDDPNVPRRFRMGFMASSDNHSARPGTGYKELRAMSDGGFDRPEEALSIIRELRAGESDEERPMPAKSTAVIIGETSPFTALADVERTGSFQYTGGLIAAHAAGRDRDSIWSALENRAVYGTSGPRILLWFDVMTESGPLPMGTEIETTEIPTFRVRAVGSHEQKPGCPQDSLDALGPDQLERLCLGECANPSDVRRPIERIDVIRIRPQTFEGEDIASLVDDPWRSFECDGDLAGCSAIFSDTEFQTSGRDAVYYARVFETPKPTANGTPLNCKQDAEGRCLEVVSCEDTGDCLGLDRPRAWSSPIYVDHPEARRRR